MVSNAQFSLIRTRVARELDIYMSKKGLEYGQLTNRIRRHPKISIGSFNRAGHDNLPLTSRAIEGLVLGKRASQGRVVNAAKDFLTLERQLPVKNGRSLIFDIDPVVIDLARRQSQFFGVENYLLKNRRDICGVYMVFHPLRFQSFILIVDYLEETNTLFCRGVMTLNRLNNPGEPVFLSGYVVLSQSSIHFFMTDHFRPEAYIIEAPIKIEEVLDGVSFFPSTQISFLIPEDKRNQVLFKINKKRFSYIDPESADLCFYPNFPNKKVFWNMINTGNLNYLFSDVFSERDYLTQPKNVLTKRLMQIAGKEYYNFKFKSDIDNICIPNNSYDIFKRTYNY